MALDSKNGKAFYRLAEAFYYKSFYSKAQKNIIEALKYIPNDEQVKNMQKMINEKIPLNDTPKETKNNNQ